VNRWFKAGASFALALVSFTIAITARSARACDFCGLPLEKQHRAGTYDVIVHTDKTLYLPGADPRLTVMIVNHGKRTLFVDPSTPVWEQTSLHVLGPSSGGSMGDVAPGKRHLRAVAPGAVFTFAASGKHGTPLSRWAGLVYRDSGTYCLDASYGGVDGPTVAFAMGRAGAVSQADARICKCTVTGRVPCR
jgi:hypothetical protein